MSHLSSGLQAGSVPPTAGLMNSNSPIAEALSSLRTAQNHTADLLGELEARLGPALTPPALAASTSGTAECKRPEGASELVEYVHRRTDASVAVNSLLQDLLQRLVV